MTSVFERTPESEEAASYGYLDLAKEIFSQVNQRRGEASQRLLEEEPTNEDLMELLFSGIGGVIKKLPFASPGALAKIEKYSKLKASLPSSLRRFLVDDKTAERLSNLAGMVKYESNVAPKTGLVSKFYRPALLTKEGKVLWDSKARIHSDILFAKLKGKKKFDYSSIVSGGGIGPDGHYYDDIWETDALTDLWRSGIKDTSKSWRP